MFKNPQPYFGIDLIEKGSGRTFWTHKASVWHDLFESVQEMVQSGQAEPISDMFNGTISCPVRAVPKGDNDTETFRSAKGQNIQQWIMLVPMPGDIDSSEYINKFISSFQALCKKSHIQSAYKSGIYAITQHVGMLNQIA